MNLARLCIYWGQFSPLSLCCLHQHDNHDYAYIEVSSILSLFAVYINLHTSRSVLSSSSLLYSSTGQPRLCLHWGQFRPVSLYCLHQHENYSYMHIEVSFILFLFPVFINRTTMTMPTFRSVPSSFSMRSVLFSFSFLYSLTRQPRLCLHCGQFLPLPLWCIYEQDNHILPSLKLLLCMRIIKSRQ